MMNVFSVNPLKFTMFPVKSFCFCSIVLMSCLVYVEVYGDFSFLRIVLIYIEF